ncbi:hypothetical protein NKH47_21565 [Mesorhizobium sp. M1060]|uniref:hypothetical protein n=1 Tax=Mesorhizobium sp. M1060 TaxID=2957052 RepID=UPI00333B4714
MAESEFVPLVVVESVPVVAPWSVLGIVVVVEDPPVVVEDPPVVVLVDWAKANPVDNAAMAAAQRSRFIVNSVFRKRPFSDETSQGNDGSKRGKKRPGIHIFAIWI